MRDKTSVSKQASLLSTSHQHPYVCSNQAFEKALGYIPLPGCRSPWRYRSRAVLFNAYGVQEDRMAVRSQQSMGVLSQQENGKAVISQGS
eukprot:1146116-Pelagomonas_calceolata.AAC.1